MKNVSKSTLAKIELIKGLIAQVKQADKLAVTYAGGTYPHYVAIESITVNNQFVTITGAQGSYIDGTERYNVNKVSFIGDDFCGKHLNYTLNVIKKALLNAIK
jgi:hypothetical protein